MQVENLKVGQVYKYKELTEILDIKYLGGKQKINQLEDFKRYFDYEKQGTKFLIKEIYKQAKEKMDMRKVVKEEDKRRLGNNNELSTHIQYSLLCLLENIEIQDRTRGVSFNRYYLYNHFGLTNDKFIGGLLNKESYAESMNMTEMAVNECYNYTYKTLYDTLDRALNSLMRRRSGFTMTKGFSYILIEDNQPVFYTASREEEAFISAVEGQVLVEQNIKDKYALFYKENDWKAFKDRVIEKLKEDYPLYFEGLDNYNNALVFSYTNDSIKLMKAKMEKDYGFNKEEVKNRLNELISDSLDGVIERRQGKSYAREQKIIKDYRKSETYLDEQRIVKDSVIKIKTEQITIKEYTENEDIPF